MITNVGLVTAAGDSPEALFAAVVAGIPLCKTREGEGFKVAEMDGFDARRHLDRKGVRDLSRTSQLACSAAARVAPGLAGLSPQDVGVVFGSAWGSLKTVVDFEREAYTEGARFVDPIRFTETVANVPAGQVSIFFGWSAFNATVSAGSASGLAALLRALDFLEEERGLAAVAGGGDELNLPMLRSFRAEHAIAGTGDSLPFGTGRSGPVGGEGAAFLTVEAEEHARSRGATPLARVRATESRFDGSAAGSAAEATLETLLWTVLESGQTAPDQVDLIVLPADGTRAGDAAHAHAVQAVFGTGSSAPPVVAPKGILGETWGAHGPLSVVLGCEAMRAGTVPPRPRGLSVDPEHSGLNLPREVLVRAIRTVLVLDGSATGHFLATLLSSPEDRS